MRARIVSWWLRAPEPWELSATWTVIYAVALVTGGVTLLSQPLSLTSEVGKAQMSAVGALFIAGAVIAMAGCGYQNGKLERIGIGLQAWGLMIYAWVLVLLHISERWSQLTQLGVVALALLGCYVVRWLLIRRREKRLAKP